MKKQLPHVSLGIILKLEVRSVVFISSSSYSPKYSEDSSVISSVKISQLKQFLKWLFVRVNLRLTLINLWLSSDIDLSIHFLIWNLLRFSICCDSFWLLFVDQLILFRLHHFYLILFSFSLYLVWFLSAHFTKLLFNSWLYNRDKF